MTTLPHDFIRLEGPAGSVELNCQEYGIVWPPPDTITHIGDDPLNEPFELIQRSVLTDEEAAVVTDGTMPARGALYWPIDTDWTGEPE